MIYSLHRIHQAIFLFRILLPDMTIVMNMYRVIESEVISYFLYQCSLENIRPLLTYLVILGFLTPKPIVGGGRGVTMKKINIRGGFRILVRVVGEIFRNKTQEKRYKTDIEKKSRKARLTVSRTQRKKKNGFVSNYYFRKVCCCF